MVLLILIDYIFATIWKSGIIYCPPSRLQIRNKLKLSSNNTKNVYFKPISNNQIIFININCFYANSYWNNIDTTIRYTFTLLILLNTIIIYFFDNFIFLFVHYKNTHISWNNNEFLHIKNNVIVVLISCIILINFIGKYYVL